MSSTVGILINLTKTQLTRPLVLSQYPGMVRWDSRLSSAYNRDLACLQPLPHLAADHGTPGVRVVRRPDNRLNGSSHILAGESEASDKGLKPLVYCSSGSVLPFARVLTDKGHALIAEKLPGAQLSSALSLVAGRGSLAQG